jgi:hypothetical protein
LTVTDKCDAVRKQKKAEYNKHYRLKRKLLLQASTSTETELAEKQKKEQYDKKLNVHLPSLNLYSITVHVAISIY